MSAKILWKLFASALFLAYAIYRLLPIQTTPFDDYIRDRATANDKEFQQILVEADARVAAFNDDTVPADKKSKTVFQALTDIGQGKGTAGKPVDMYQFFPDMKVVEEPNIPRRNGYILRELLLQSQGKLKLGLDLQGGVSFTLRVDPSNFEAKEDAAMNDTQKKNAQEIAEAAKARLKDGLNRAIQVMEGRVNFSGVAEPIIRPVGDDSIEIQLPGAEAANDPAAIDTLKKPAKLEFRVVHRYIEPENGTPEHRIVPLRENPGDATSAIADYEVLYQRNENRETGVVSEVPLYIKKYPDATGNIVAKASHRSTAGDKEARTPWVTTIDFTSDGAKKFEFLTGKIADINNAEVRQYGAIRSHGALAIVLDNELIMAPGIEADRATGLYRALGSGGVFIGASTEKSAVDLANVLNNPLEFPLELQDSKQVSGTLAEDAQIKSIQAATIGITLIFAFLLIYYLWAGIIAICGLVLNVVLMLGVMAAFGATITLPGVAALVLTIGMAVDANILVFERIREEIANGKPFRAAVAAGYDQAQRTILDANLTSLMTAVILIVMGTGPIRGFGIILSIGLVTTVFTALITCRALQEICVEKEIFKNIFGLNLFKGNTKFQFLNFTRPAFIISWSLVAITVGLIFIKGEKAFSKDFLGGEAIIVRVEQGKELETGAIIKAVQDAGVSDVTTSYQKALSGNKEITLRIETELSTGKGLPDFTQANKAAEAVRAAYPDYFPQGELNSIVAGRESIGGAISGNLQKNAIISVVLALIGLAVYVGLRFEAGMGLGALVSSLHDLLLTSGIYILLGGQFSLSMIAAILMVLGYSINDTIVVFDRIREELQRHPAMGLRDIIHLSINRTLSRTLLTSITTLLSALALWLFGAGDVQEYGFLFVIGIIVGTFSSIYIASPIFYWWHRGERVSVERAEARVTYSWEAGSTKAEEK